MDDKIFVAQRRYQFLYCGATLLHYNTVEFA